MMEIGDPFVKRTDGKNKLFLLIFGFIAVITIFMFNSKAFASGPAPPYLLIKPIYYSLDEGDSVGCELSLWPNTYSPFGNYTIIGYDLGWFSFGDRNEIYGDVQLSFYYFEREMIFAGISLGVVHDYSSGYSGIQGQVWINYLNFGIVYRPVYINQEVEHTVGVYVNIPLFVGIGGPKIYKPETVKDNVTNKNYN